MAGTCFDGFARNVAREAKPRRALIAALVAAALGSVPPVVEDAMAKVQCRQGQHRCHGKCCPRRGPVCCSHGCCKKGFECCQGNKCCRK